jgi:hypothetical protein
MSKRKIVLLAAVAGVGLVSMPSATKAVTVAGSQNPAITVTLTVTPERLAPGGVATGTGYITNNSTVRQRMTVRGAITFPDGRSFTKDRVISVAPGKTLSLSRTIATDKRQGRGTYIVTVFATTTAGTSQASVKIEVK